MATHCSILRKFYGQRSTAVYSPWVLKELDRPSTHTLLISLHFCVIFQMYAFKVNHILNHILTFFPILPSKKPQGLKDANTELFQTLRNSMSQRTVFLLNVCAQILNKILGNIFKFQQYLFKKITKCHLFQEYKDGLTFENQSI